LKDNLVTRIVQAFRPTNYSNNDLPIKSLQATSLQSLREFTRYETDNYDSGYSSVRAISDSFLKIKPFAVDNNGKPLAVTPNVINCLARPNTEMSSIDFRDALSTLTQVYDKVYILVHERFGNTTRPASENVNEDMIAGFTFIQGVVEEVVEGKLQYKIYVNGLPKVYHPYQVMAFYDINPANLGHGYSPARAAKRWTRIEDYIADYQAGFFENGAVPSGQFVITAPTTKEYNDIVDNLEAKHKGAGKNNNVVYTFQPIDPNTGKAAQATITWIPFNTQNKDMALKDILEAVTAKTDSVYRVSAMQRAVTDAPNFATAQVDDRNFVEKTLRPFSLKRYSRLQHELNRITGGLGYGITFKLDTPNIAEEQKAEAETNMLRISAITTMTTFGFTLDSVINALQLPNNWKSLQKGTSLVTKIENDKADVDDGDEVADTPIVDPSNKVKVGKRSTNPKVSNRISEEDILNYYNQLYEPTRVLMDKQIENAINTLDPVDEIVATDEDKDQFVDDMMLIIAGILLYGGIQQWEAGRSLLQESGLIAPNTPYTLQTSAITRYRAYLNGIADSYTDDTAKAIRGVLARANDETWTRDTLKTNLRGIIQTDEWRIDRLAMSEINRSSGISSVESMMKIQEDSGYNVEKTMASSTGSPCQFCATLIGVWFPVDNVMVQKGQIINGIDGGTFVNNWTDNSGHDLHANGRCYPVYRVAQ